MCVHVNEHVFVPNRLRISRISSSVSSDYRPPSSVFPRERQIPGEGTGNDGVRTSERADPEGSHVDGVDDRADDSFPVATSLSKKRGKPT